MSGARERNAAANSGRIFRGGATLAGDSRGVFPAFGDLAPVAYRREGRFDGVCRAKVHPTLGPEVVERQLGDRLPELRAGVRKGAVAHGQVT